MPVRKLRIAVLVVILAVAGAACAESDPGDETEGDGDELSLSIGDVPDSVEGNVVSLPIEVGGIEIVGADGDDSGETGHLHVFIDEEPVDVGETIPMEKGVTVHSADNPVVVSGLEPGSHEFTVVLGDGVHTRIGEGVEDSVTVDVEGPSVQGSAPATIDEGEDLTVEFEAEGVEIVAADGDNSGDSGHFHVLVDPESPPEAGDVIPELEAGKIYHTAESEVTVEGLEAGVHIIWVVLGDGTHAAFDPPVMDKLTVTVG
ncbi:MAG: DUF4399 domain-containing protein [Actinomycetota bacterium]